MAVGIRADDHVTIVVALQIGDLAQQGDGVVAGGEAVGLPCGGDGVLLDLMALGDDSAAGLGVRGIVRAKEAVFTELGLDDPAKTDEELIDAMMAHPILINRPIVVTPLGTRLCRPSEEVLDILPQPQRGGFAKGDGEQVIDAEGRRV